MSLVRKMQSIFLRKSRRLTGLVTLLCCLLFIYILRFYQDDLSKKSFSSEFGSEFDGKVTCEGFTSNQVLLTTPNKIILYDLKSGFSRIVHAGDGLYYNSFKGPNSNDPVTGKCQPTLIVNTRKYYEKGTEKIPDKILKIDMSSGKILQSHALSYSFFSHDMVKFQDLLFLADTGHGFVWLIDLKSFDAKEKLTMFTKEDHINNLGICNDLLFAMLHSRGASGIAVVDLKTKETIIMRGVGNQAHQIMFLNYRQILYLDSGLPALKMFDLVTWKVYTLFQSSEDPKRFLKGLFVKDNVAYIGSTVAGSRAWRRDRDNDAELIAFDLKLFQVLYKRKIDSDGILNTISQPFLREDSGFMAIDSDLIVPDSRMELPQSLTIEQRQAALDGSRGELLRRIKGGLEIKITDGALGGNAKQELPKDYKERDNIPNVKDAPVAKKNGNKEVVVYDKSGRDFSEVTPDNLIGGEWPSGMKFIDLMWKSQDKTMDLTSKVDRAEDVQLIMGDLNGGHLPLRDMLMNLPIEQWEYKHQKGNAFLGEREGVMQKFKPGVRDIKFVFSDINAENSYWFPWYFKFEKALKPILDKVLGENMTHHVARMQLARMANDAEIKPHVDSGGWPSKLHRIHVPIIVPSGTVFSVVGRHGHDHSYSIRLVEGEVFEINNRVMHWVKNPSDPRIHLLIDARERPYIPKYLAPGQECKYLREIVCDEPTITKEKAYALYQQQLSQS